MHHETIADAVRNRFGRGRALVLGDLMLDRYVWGDVSRVSPEAPVPVLRPRRHAERAGGAGNLALNLVGLGLQPVLAGYVGQDDYAASLAAIWQHHDVPSDLVVTLEGRATTTKTRIIAVNQHVLRVDDEDLAPVAPSDQQRLLEAVLDCLADVDVVLLSDYGKNVLVPEVCQQVITHAKRRELPVFVDPKGQRYEKYAGATILTPNLKELELATGVTEHEFDALLEAGRRAVSELDLEAIVVTRSQHGMTLIAADETIHSPAIAREVYDVSGAGDTVVASLAAGTLAGLSRPDMLHLANVAAGLVVAKTGTAPVEHEELLHALYPHGQLASELIFTLERLESTASRWRANGERIVFTNGCFDLLHPGHVALLRQARAACDRLIVGLNSDASVRGLKGDGRPVQDETARAAVLSSLADVDQVVIFAEPTPAALIEAIRPDVLVKGADYSLDQVVGAEFVQSYGGRILLAEIEPGHSTTGTIEKLSG